MAIPNTLAVAQDNKFEGSDLLPLHSPLTFLINQTHGGSPSEFLSVGIFVNGSSILTQKAIPWASVSSTVRQFRWDAGVILKSFLPHMGDVLQTVGTLAIVDAIAEFKLRFYGLGSEFVDIDFIGAHGARQWGEHPNMLDVYSNESKTYNCATSCYTYYYSRTAGDTLQANDSNVVGSTQIGLYRYFNDFENSGSVTFYKNAVSDVTHIVTLQKSCNDYELKYIDRNGQYRFLGFNKFFEVNDKNEHIGSVNRFATTIRTGQSSDNSLGYRNTRSLSLTAEALSLTELETLGDLESSPVVYLKINNTDTDADWVLTKIKGRGIIRPVKNQFTDVTYVVELPERYTLSLI